VQNPDDGEERLVKPFSLLSESLLPPSSVALVIVSFPLIMCLLTMHFEGG